MIEKTVPVSHKGNKVADINVPVYENVDELMAAESVEKILSMFNKANIIRMQANERSKHTEGKMGKMKTRGLAFKLLTPDEISQFAGDFAALNTFLDSEDMANRVKESL